MNLLSEKLHLWKAFREVIFHVELSLCPELCSSGHGPSARFHGARGLLNFSGAQTTVHSFSPVQQLVDGS